MCTEIRHRLPGLLLLLAVCASGCAISAPDHPLALRTLAQGSFCRDGTTHAQIITAEAGYRTAWRNLQGNVLPDTRTPPAIDFTRERVIAIYMGRRSTAGYRVEPAAATAILQAGGILEIPVTWTEPPPGTAQAQAITAPCVLVAVTQGDYTAVRIVDAQGRVRIGE